MGSKAHTAFKDFLGCFLLIYMICVCVKIRQRVNDNKFLMLQASMISKSRKLKCNLCALSVVVIFNMYFHIYTIATIRKSKK